MHKINDYVIYKREVCIIKDILPKYYREEDYYLLSQLSDDTLIIKIPVSNLEIRDIISKKEVEKLIKKIPDIDIVNSNTKELDNIYKSLIASYSHEDLIKIIKTSYLRNKERLDSNKKTTDKDNYYFNLAEKYLYQEFSIALNLPYEETKKYVIDRVTNLYNQ